MGRDLEGQRADDDVDHTLHEEARAGEQFERTEPGHESMVCRRSEVVRIVLLVS